MLRLYYNIIYLINYISLLMYNYYHSNSIPLAGMDFHDPSNPHIYVPDLYVRSKYKYDPNPPKFYYKKSHLPKVDYYKKLKFESPYKHHRGHSVGMSGIKIESKVKKMKGRDYDMMMAMNQASPVYGSTY